jgi:hypothetical protein
MTAWNDNPYLLQAEPGLDQELRRFGHLILMPTSGVFGQIKVTYSSAKGNATYNVDAQRIVIEQLSQAKTGPITQKQPWSNHGIERAVINVIVSTINNAAQGARFGETLFVSTRSGQPLFNPNA